MCFCLRLENTIQPFNKAVAGCGVYVFPLLRRLKAMPYAVLRIGPFHRSSSMRVLFVRRGGSVTKDNAPPASFAVLRSWRLQLRR